MRIKIYIFVALLLVFFLKLNAQEVEANAKLSKDSIIIGDQITLTLSLFCDDDYNVLWPYFSDTLVHNVEILSSTPIDSVKKDGFITYEQKYTITSFDSGYYVIKPYVFEIHRANDTTSKQIFTQALLLEVHNVAVDTSLAIKDIKPPLKAPVSFLEILPWLLSALILIIIALLIIFYVLFRKKKIKPIFKREKPRIPPHKSALDALEKLRLQKIWQSGKTKSYYTKLTNIIRNYMEERFTFEAKEMTSNEIIHELKKVDINEKQISNIKQTLFLSDLAKFAKEKPLPADNDMSMSYCKEFVETTKEVAEENLNEQKNKIDAPVQ